MSDNEKEVIGKNPNRILDKMKVSVTSSENRPISFTNKESSYYYTQSHINNHPEHSFFEGLTISQQKIFDGYEIYFNDEVLDKTASILEVFPHMTKRQYRNGIVEEFWMYDKINVLEIGLKNGNPNDLFGIKLKGVKIDNNNSSSGAVYFHTIKRESIHPSNTTYHLAILSTNGSELRYMNKKVVGSDLDGFLIIVGKTIKEVKALIAKYESSSNWKKTRITRIQDIVEKSIGITSNSDSLDLALSWLGVTTDQVVSNQQGFGIYAGLPWFAEYWGRDQFISMPGATLVIGEFEVARKILLSFAKHQDTIRNSKFYGRVPNIVKPGSSDYHTTDGTPRFVIQLLDYVKYSGDKEIISSLYPNVKHSIEGSLKNWTDEKGFLLHEDNETWMDARRNYDKTSYSPRATRANDIQALWYQQLSAGAYFAEYQGDQDFAKKCKKIANKVKANFEREYTSGRQNFIADRLDKNDRPEFILRPNQLFTFELVDNLKLKLTSLRKSWEEMVYPWGTSSLGQNEEFFHPYHLKWDNYHKDEAYHNGTIWVWLNGISMQRMIEFNQIETAFELFENVNRQILNIGVVGGLSENLDAYPDNGQSYPKLTGTYLQAWSNAEHLRIWYQYFLGVRPDLIKDELGLAPRIPKSITELETKASIGRGSIGFSFNRKTDLTNYRYSINGFSGEVIFDLPKYLSQRINVEDGQVLEIAEKGQMIKISLFKSSAKTEIVYSKSLDESDLKLEEQDYIDDMLKNIRFCTPLPPNSHDVLNKQFNGDRGI